MGIFASFKVFIMCHLLASPMHSGEKVGGRDSVHAISRSDCFKAIPLDISSLSNNVSVRELRLGSGGLMPRALYIVGCIEE